MGKVNVDLEDFMMWFVTHYEVEDMRVYELEYGEEWTRKNVINEYLDLDYVKDKNNAWQVTTNIV